MPDIPVNSIIGYIGVFLLVLGIFLVLTGFSIIKIQQVTVTPGKKTWLLGIILAVAGIVSITLEISGNPVERITENHIATPTTVISRDAVNLTQDENLENAKTWPVLLSSSFDDDDGKWVLGDFNDGRETGEWFISDKKYVWKMTALVDDTMRVNYPTLSPISDFYLSVDIKLITGSPNNVRYGLIFRGTGDSSYYTFRLEDGPYYRVRIKSSGNWDNLTEKISSSAIQLQNINRLTVIADGYHFLFYINDQFVDEVFDSRLENGNLGIATTINVNGEDATIEFDNFEVRKKP